MTEFVRRFERGSIMEPSSLTEGLWWSPGPEHHRLVPFERLLDVAPGRRWEFNPRDLGVDHTPQQGVGDDNHR